MEFPALIDIAKKLWRRKFWLIAPLVAGVLAAVLAVKNIEPRYRARALILVEAQKIPKQFVEDTVTAGVVDRLRWIELQVKQDEMLEKMIRELDLYPELLRQGLISEAVRTARGSLDVSQNQRERTVSITFSGPDRLQVAAAANGIAELVVQENTRMRAQGAQGTTAFVEAEIGKAQKMLEEKAAEIAALKKRWDGRLPEQRTGNQRALEELDRRLVVVESSIDNAETRRLLLQSAGRQGLAIVAEQVPRQNRELADKRLELQKLLVNFTDKHPSVIRLRKEIAALEQLAATAPQVAPVEAPVEAVQQDPLLQAELAALDAELARLQSERGQIQSDMARYRRRLERVPELEQQLTNLQGQYANAQGFYGSLLKQQIEAQLAENLEERQQSEQFTILERASPPFAPYSPNVPLLLFAGFGLGGALGVALVFLREETDHTFRDPDALKEAFPGVEVLTVIPRLGERPVLSYSHRRRKRTA